jgi:hypothetical protein
MAVEARVEYSACRRVKPNTLRVYGWEKVVRKVERDRCPSPSVNAFASVAHNGTKNRNARRRNAGIPIHASSAVLVLPCVLAMLFGTHPLFPQG